MTFKNGIHPVYHGKELSESAATEVSPLLERYTVAVSQNAGKPPEIIVNPGDKVKKYQLIAKASGFVSANLHSPTSGEVKAIIEIKIRPEREGGFDRIARRLSKFPQVTSLYLMSGGFDLMAEVRGATLNDVAMFVSSKLATIDGVLSTATHFLLKKYKESGKLYEEEETNERLQVTP